MECARSGRPLFNRSGCACLLSFVLSSGSTGRRAAPSFFAGRAVPGSFLSRVLYYNKVNNKGGGFKVFIYVNI